MSVTNYEQLNNFGINIHVVVKNYVIYYFFCNFMESILETAKGIHLFGEDQ